MFLISKFLISITFNWFDRRADPRRGRDSGVSPSSDTKVVRFFEKTNKITTNYQILELSDPLRPYMACCPKRNFDFWLNLLKALNIPIYIGSFRAVSDCSRFRAPSPCSGLPGPSWAFLGSRLLQALWWSERGQEMPLPNSLQPPATTSSACNQRSPDHHHQRPEGNLESF